MSRGGEMDTEGSISWEIAERLVKLAEDEGAGPHVILFVLALAQIKTKSKIIW
jgi:hypothetical protein